MKKIVIFITLIFALLMCMASCNLFATKDVPNEPSDGECHHVFGEWETLKNPTCFEEGLKGRQCYLCELWQSEPIPMAHKIAIDASITPTCTETGLTEGKHCSICEAVLVTQTIVDVLGHDLVGGICKRCSATESQGLEFTLNSDGRSYSVSGKGTCTDTDVIIPSTYNDKPVTSIGNEVFYECLDLTSITIPDDITSIGRYAFSRCSNLTSVVIGDSVTSIGYATFESCRSLASVIIGDSVASIGDYAFYYCDSLTSIIIPDSVTSIGDHAFSSCNSLTSIIIPDSVTSIGEAVFYDCRSLTSITIPASVISIPDRAFIGYFGSIKIDSNNSSYKEIDGNLYSKDGTRLIHYACDKTTFSIPDGVASIGDAAFSSCDNLTSVVIPDSVTSIGDYAFEDCENLTSIIIPDSVTSIGYQAFAYCVSLTSVVIPDSVTSIGDWAFYSCSNLTYNVKDGLKYLGNNNNPYLYLAVTISKNIITANIDSNCKIISYEAFEDCENLTSIIIPDSVASIGDSAFSDCTSLTNINFEGTIAQWNDISFGSSWKYNVPAAEVICSDGTVTLQE